jgi:hypothetical protein
MHNFCWQVFAHPPVHERLIAETLDADLSATVPYQERIVLPYFQTCLKEALRLQPTFAMSISRKVPSTGALVAGFAFDGSQQMTPQVAGFPATGCWSAWYRQEPRMPIYRF